MAGGTRSQAEIVVAVVVAESAPAGTAVTAGQALIDFAVPCDCKIGGVKARAEVAGTGAGSTVLDVLLNGVSVWDATADKPQLAATLTGEFASKVPARRSLRAGSGAGGSGDYLGVKVSSVSSTGHGRVSVAIALESPVGRAPTVGGFN
jgi:hypothetical protein